MAVESNPAAGTQSLNSTSARVGETQPQKPTGWKRFLPSRKAADEGSSVDSNEEFKDDVPTAKWNLGILNDKETEEVPGQYTLCPSRRSAIFDRS